MKNNNNTLPAKTENLISTIRFESSKSEQIVRASFGLKIKDIEPGNDEPIKQVLRYVFTLIGLRAENIPDDLQKLVLIDFIRSELGNFTIDDIRTAFVLAVKNELKAEINHFQNFSALYLGQVLNVYQNEKNKAISEFKKAEERQKRLEEEKNGPSPEKLKQIQNDFDLNCVVGPFKNFLETEKIDFEGVPISLIYESLFKRHKIIELTDSRKENFKKTANKLKIDLTKSSKPSFINQKDTGSTFSNNCQFLAVEYLFKQLKKNGQDLAQLMNLKP